MPYRAGVIGLTGIGASPPRTAPDPVLGMLMPHSHVSAYAEIPQVELVAVCDINPVQIERFKEQWGSRLPDVTIYTDYREMLSKERLDLLSVVTGDHVHAQMVVDGTEAGVKGIFCEKPIATTLSDADRMIAACRAQNVPLLIDHTRRWWPEFAHARQRLRTREIGKLQSIVASLTGPRAMLFRNGTHLIDTVCYFVDSDPEWVVAELEETHRNHPPRYVGDGGKDPAKDPAGSAYVHFANGVRAFINITKTAVGSSSWELYGESGMIRIGPARSEVVRSGEDRQLTYAEMRPPYVTRGDMVAAIYELIDLIENGGEGTSTGEDGRRTLSIMLGMLQSNDAGNIKVKFPIHDK